MSTNRYARKVGDQIVIGGTCSITRELYEVRVPVELYERWKSGEYIQKVFPMLNPDQREFMLTGYTPAEWTDIFGAEET
jgi:hypothetical protein